nr:CHRD domain-containing protein [Kibdelosporangium sp. MJ126-NF4]CEL17467.1 hypothetical protein [Kibdelosporangium sp. MJ126-NF4]CTQ91306.1 hypothetical protein [Kibdelosporangium sp. MJ126-NF4]
MTVSFRRSAVGAAAVAVALAVVAPATASANENHADHGAHSSHDGHGQSGTILGVGLNVNLNLGLSSARYAVLTGAAEVPGPGDSDGRGSATVRAGRDRVCVSLNVRKIQQATAAHIHRGERRTAGPVVVNLTAPSDGYSHSCTAVGRDLAKEIRNHPSRFYVNVHNGEFPAGAVRGQLRG